MYTYDDLERESRLFLSHCDQFYVTQLHIQPSLSEILGLATRVTVEQAKELERIKNSPPEK